MPIPERADFTIPDGMIERFEVPAGAFSRHSGDTVSTRLIRIIRHAIGSKYEIVGTPSLPTIASVSVPEAELPELRTAFVAAAAVARKNLMARYALIHPDYVPDASDLNPTDPTAES